MVRGMQLNRGNMLVIKIKDKKLENKTTKMEHKYSQRKMRIFVFSNNILFKK